MNILVAMPAGEVRDSFIPGGVRAQLEELGTVVWNEDGRNWTEDELAAHIEHIDVCVLGWGCPPVGEKALIRADALKAVLHTGGSVAGYAAETVYDRHIPVLSGNELYARSVAESVVAYALYLLRDIGRYNGELLRDGWSQPGWKNEGLLDQTVGLIGFGAVARWTARLLSAFGVKLFINADHVTPEEAASYGARKATIDEIMSGCKIVSVHLARTPETHHIIDGRRLKLLREGAVFINTARGSIVDEAALARELATGRFKAALDVYEVEPLPMDSPLRTLPNVLLMPHMGGPTMDRRPFVTRALIEELPKVLAGETSYLTITRDMMRRMTR